MNTYNRGKLKREVAAGKWLVKCDGTYTDDYAFDASVNFGITDFAPAGYFPLFNDWLSTSGLTMPPAFPYSQEAEAERYRVRMAYDAARRGANSGAGHVFDADDFAGYGRAYEIEGGMVRLSFGNYQSFTFRRA